MTSDHARQVTMEAFQIAFCILLVVCTAAALTKYILLLAVCIQLGHTTAK